MFVEQLLPAASCSADFQINYERHRAQGRPISSAGALLQVQCAVLNAQDVRNVV